MGGESSFESATLGTLVDAVVALDPQPRERRWVSLSLCIADAVWSIGANYDTVVVPVVRGLAAKLGVDHPTQPVSDAMGDDPLPATRLTELDLNELTGLTNRQRTSTRGGILKADAVQRHAKVFADHEVATLGNAIALFTNTEKFDRINKSLQSIPGEGSNAVRRDYLWMLIGQDDLIKPDRMVLRWFNYHGVTVDPASARDLITKMVPEVGTRLNRPVTAWEIDHALWQAGRGMAA